MESQPSSISSNLLYVADLHEALDMLNGSSEQTYDQSQLSVPSESSSVAALLAAITDYASKINSREEEDQITECGGFP